jgi:hypothetical protein
VSFFTEANDILRTAIAESIFDPRPEAIQQLSGCKSSALSGLMESLALQRRQNLESSPWLEQQSSWQLPATRRYVQSRHPPIVPVVQADATQDWMVELARYPVSYGSVGVVKSLEQFVSQGQDIYTLSQHWGDPFVSSVPITWYLRLSPIGRLGAAWVNYQGASVIENYLPGTPYSDLDRTDDIWFPAASCAAANVHLVVPGGSVLRIFAIVEGSQQGDPVSIACKLAGTVQLETNPDAQTALRTQW